MASLVVQVIDVEDVGPAFVAVPPVTPIREDVPVSTFVLQGNTDAICGFMWYSCYFLVFLPIKKSMHESNRKLVHAIIRNSLFSSSFQSNICLYLCSASC